MSENVCKFITTQKYNEGISIINFVYEKTADFKKEYIFPSTYTLAIVTDGEGILHTHSGKFSLARGDLFVIFSAKAYYIENTGGLKYIYVSFTGLRSQVLIDRLKISHTSPVFHGYDFLIDTWESVIAVANDNNSDLFCEGLLLHTFGFLCTDSSEELHSDKANGLLLAKQYIDANYTDSELDLKSVSNRFSYNSKYFSAAFKKMVRISFSDYLKMKRLAYAVTLIESGITNVNDLAELCGYKEAPYFSKCFKKEYGVSPKRWSERNI